MARYPLAIKVANLLVYVFLLGANVYSIFGPDSEESPYHQRHPTYITPASYVFGVWGLIHFLLGGFVIYQFFGAHDLIVDGINWHFVGITLLNTLWLVLWQTDYLILSWIAILFTATQVTYIYSLLKQNRGEGSTATLNELVWVHAPFSLYHAWVVVIAVISTFAAFVPDKKDDEPPSLLIKILVVLALLFLKSTAVLYIEKSRGDIVGSIVIAWTLYGIAVEQSDAVIHWSALILAILASIHILVPIIRKLRHPNEESVPLLG